MKTLAIISGGDAPGINAALHHYTLLAEAAGDSLVGAVGGFAGALKRQIVPLASAALRPLIGLGGSFLPSSREPVLKTDEGRNGLVACLDEQQVDNVVLFGGNGSLTTLLPILRDLAIPCIGLPNTIDNDVPGTERTLGFDSACNFAYPVASGIMATAHALPGRIFTLETLGGDSGLLALDIALGVGAHAVLVREYDYGDEWLRQRMLDSISRYDYALVVHCEGARGSRTLADDLYRLTGIRVRDTRLGHAQRGGTPTHIDRVLALQMARTAYQALRDGVKMGIVAVVEGRVKLREGTLEGLPTPMPDRAAYDFVNGL